MAQTKEEIIKDFTKELSEKVRYFAGHGQYEKGSIEHTAYIDGVETAIGMMYIDLTGTPKTEGMLHKALSTLEQATILRCIEALGERKSVIELYPEATLNTLDEDLPFQVSFKEGYNKAIDTNKNSLKALLQDKK